MQFNVHRYDWCLPQEAVKICRLDQESNPRHLELCTNRATSCAHCGRNLRWTCYIRKLLLYIILIYNSTFQPYNGRYKKICGKYCLHWHNSFSNKLFTIKHKIYNFKYWFDTHIANIYHIWYSTDARMFTKHVK